MSALLALFASSFPTLLAPEPSPLFTTLAPIADGPELEYTYVEANYIWTDLDVGDEKLDGAELIGSLELPANFFGQVTASTQSDETDVEVYRIGAGWHFGLIPRLDLFAIVSYLHVEADNASFDSKEDGVQGDLGVRFLLTDRIELNGKMIWQDIDDEDDVGFGLGARFYLIDRLSLGARMESLDEDETFAVGLRFDF
jgi:hypothetical protein